MFKITPCPFCKKKSCDNVICKSKNHELLGRARKVIIDAKEYTDLAEDLKKNPPETEGEIAFWHNAMDCRLQTVGNEVYSLIDEIGRKNYDLLYEHFLGIKP